MTTNSNSVVVRLLKDGKPFLLLPGDIDEIGLQNLLGRNYGDISAEIAVFPTTAGGPTSAGMENFAITFCRATKPEALIFSIGRGKYDTQKPEIVAAVRKERYGGPHSVHPIVQAPVMPVKVPRVEPTHLSGKVSRGKESRKCCAGTVHITLAQKPSNVLPILNAHATFIARRPRRTHFA